MFSGASVIYKTITQCVVALSSTEAEFYALDEAGKSSLYLCLVLVDRNLEQVEPTTVYKDNRACLHLTKSSKLTK